ncbi:shikimate kinase AroK [Buchnera aphidicola]|uniref:Shikimate kinase 1 n=1 Tax=Buchnera aphidicola subsp. Tuberolachnus salignus TaxID=98804 RepID=A0A160SYJ3_BUCTT|nr:shikimate kinase AroK [Buchnera aphidicola]CUR53334.1 Shikimate kinase 1 [Buchnera aphidicola (Tuberolachnus salignus)]
MVEKQNIFLIGPMGAGKSTIGRQLAKFLHMKFYDSDLEIEKRTGADISWVFDVEGEKGFRLREEKILNELTQKKNIVLATGGGSILSECAQKYFITRGIVIYLKTTIENQLIRIPSDKKRPLLNTKKTQKDKKKILENLAYVRNPIYKNISDIIVDTTSKNPKILVVQIFKILKNFQK